MWRKAATSRMSKSGVVKIRRDSYSTVNGFSVKNSWWDLVAAVRTRAKGQCEAQVNSKRCTAKGNECHHITKLSSGGTNTIANLIFLCQACHDRRHHHLFRQRG